MEVFNPTCKGVQVAMRNTFMTLAIDRDRAKVIAEAHLDMYIHNVEVKVDTSIIDVT